MNGTIEDHTSDPCFRGSEVFDKDETMMAEQYVIGVDFGSDSVRAIVVNTVTGKEAGSAAACYPRWKKGLYQHPEKDIFRQHPKDYLEALEECVTGALAALSAEQRAAVVGIGIDTTGSTPVPVDREGTPLSLLPGFEENENAMFHLWKDHSAFREAAEIDEMFSGGSDTDYTRYQGTYCSEWFWAKVLHTTRTDSQIRSAAYTWVEHCDWMVGLLCGNTCPEQMYHSACAAGHKALWHSAWNGLPGEDVLARLDPALSRIRERYGRAPECSDAVAGTLCGEWAQRLGLSEQVKVSGSSFDAHAGAVGAGIREKTVVCTIGTSAVDMIVARPEDLEGKDLFCYGGQAENSIVPGYVGVETGQAAFGDIFAWFKKLLLWPVKTAASEKNGEWDGMLEELEERVLVDLQKAAMELPREPFPISLDWFNGRRYPENDDFQKAVIADVSLGTEAPYLYRSLVFGAICGLKRILEGFMRQGVELEHVVAAGGISKKSDYVMQMMADMLGKEVDILEADQTCALGAAIYAAVAGGAYDTFQEASAHLASPVIRTYRPDPEAGAWYQEHYEEYLRLAGLQDQRNKK